MSNLVLQVVNQINVENLQAIELVPNKRITIKTEPNINYLVVEQTTQRSPVFLSLKRNGGNLIIKCDNGSEVVIEDYYNIENNQLIGVLNAEYYNYNTTSLTDLSEFTNIELLENGDKHIEPWWYADSSESFSIPLIAGLAGLGLVGLAAGGGSGKSSIKDQQGTSPEVNTNNNPTSQNTTIKIEEDTTKTGKLAVATDIDGDSLTYTLKNQASNGQVEVTADGSYTYTPNANFNGSDSFTYTISDGKGGEIIKTASVTVSNVNDKPTAEDTTISTNEDQAKTGKLAVATDIDGDSLTYTLKDQASNGQVEVTTDGNYTYTPNANFNGSDSFTYTISDGKGGEIIKTASVTVSNVNDKPTAEDTTISTNEDQAKTGKLAVATDIDGDSLTYTLKDQASNGQVEVTADGSYTYTPDANFNGSDSFTYTISDGKGGEIVRTASVTVNNTNLAPTAENVIPFNPIKYEDTYYRGINSIPTNDNKLIVVEGRNIARYHQDGTLDTSFNTEGAVPGELNIHDIGDLDFYQNSFSKVAVTGDNSIIGVLKLDWTGYGIVKVTPDGQIDKDFNKDSYVPGMYQIGRDEGFRDFKVLQSGKIAVFTKADDVDKTTITILDSDGKQNSNTQLEFKIEGDSSIVEIDNTHFLLKTESTIKKITADGVPDSSFSIDGSLVVDEKTIIQKANDSIYVIKRGDYIAKIKADGSLDTSFNTNGEEPGKIYFPDKQYSNISDYHITADNEIIVGKLLGNKIKFAKYSADGEEIANIKNISVVDFVGKGKRSSYSVGYDTEIFNISDGKDNTVLVTVGLNNKSYIINYNLDGTINYNFNAKGIQAYEDIPYIFQGTEFGFSDEDGGELEAIIIDTLPEKGRLLLDGVVVAGNAEIQLSDIKAGKLTYLGDSNEFGDNYSSFTYKVKDNQGADTVGQNISSNTADVIFSIKPLNDAQPMFSDAQKSGMTKIRNLHLKYETYITNVNLAEDGSLVLFGNGGYGSSNESYSLHKYNELGVLDTSFNPSSKHPNVIYSYTSTIDENFVKYSNNKGLINETDGSIIFVEGAGSNSDFKIRKFNSDFTLKSDFGNNGELYVDFNDGYKGFRSATLTASNKILIYAVTNNDSELIQLNTDGSLDTSFNNSGEIPGLLKLDNSTRDYSSIENIYTTNQDKILVAYSTENANSNNSNNTTDFVIAQYNSDGTLDVTFNPTGDVPGLIKQDICDEDIYKELLQTEDGKIFLIGNSYDRLPGTGGNTYDYTNTKPVIISYNADGSLNTDFNTNGSLPGVLYGIESTLLQAELTADNKLLVVSNVNASPNRSSAGENLLVTKYTLDGSLDTSFNANGATPGMLTINSPYGGFLETANININENNEVFVVLTGDSHSIYPGYAGTVLKINADGTLDKNFGDTYEFIGNQGVTQYKQGETVALNSEIKLYDEDASLINNYAGTSLYLETGGYVFTGSGNLILADNQVRLSNQVVGEYSKTEIGRLSITFNNNATQEVVDEVAQSIAITDHFVDKDYTDKTVEWTFIDTGGDATSHTQEITNIPATDGLENRFYLDTDEDYLVSDPFHVNNQNYFQLSDSSAFAWIDGKTDHDYLDTIFNNGDNTTDTDRDVVIGNKNVRLPSIDELLDVYNDNSIEPEIKDTWFDSSYESSTWWSSTPGVSGTADTHMALNIATGTVLELPDTFEAMTYVQII